MQTDNPYSSPTDAGLPSNAGVVTGPLPLASTGARFANLIIDNIVTWILSSIAGVIVGVAYVLTRSDPTAPIAPEEETSMQLMGYGVGILVVLAYFLLIEGLFQRSLAKFITGTRVVRADGGRPSFGQILGRTFARFIPFEAFSFLGGDGKPVGWHDSLSGTRVISTRQ